MANQTIEITTEEYKKFVKDSALLQIVKDFVEDSKYIHRSDMASLLGLKQIEE